MKVLVIGGGGREHALVWKLQQSPECSEIWCAPGNAGIRELAGTISIKVDDIEGLVQFATEKSFELVVIGPEAPLAAGLSDALRAKEVPVFGPSQAAAQIESSKSFARRLMKKYNIPTPKFAVLNHPQQAKEYVRELHEEGMQCVVKADGLAAGKGAIVTSMPEEADLAIDKCMIEKEFGEAGSTIVVEERLSGPELSVLAITDGKRMLVLPPAQDHKPIGEGDTGPNTGGMGAYCPVPVGDEPLMQSIVEQVLRPTIEGMNQEGIPYTGVLYAGLMLTEKGPYVIEFNCRFGDPEAQVVLPVVEEDLLPVLAGAARGEMTQEGILQARQDALCVVLASGGYPGKYETHKPIHGLREVEEEMEDNAIVFHSGTILQEGTLLSAGGRVLGVTGLGENFNQAYNHAYDAASLISFENVYYRKDIGYRVKAWI